MLDRGTRNFDLGIADIDRHLLESSRFTLGDALEKAARVYGDRPAVVGEDGSVVTYAELNDRVNSLATALQGRGVDYGSRLAIRAENRPEYVEVVFAGAKLGALVATQNIRLERTEALHCLSVADPDVVFVSGQTDQTVEWIDEEDDLSPLLVDFDGIDGTDRPQIDYADLVSAGEAEAPTPSQPVSMEDGLVVLYTSGTTGLPKGAVISHRAEMARALVRGGDPEPEVVAWAPMYHMISMDPLFSVVLRGGTYHVLDGFNVEQILERHRTTGASSLQLLPSTIEPILDHADAHDIPAETFDAVETLGAMPDLIPPAQIEAITTLAEAEFTNSFGSTETGSPPATGATIPPGIAPGPDDLSKKESPLCAVRLVDDDWNTVPQGEIGEIAVRGPTLFSGYLDAPEANETDFQDGWFRMGDLFVRNADGTLDFVDRRTYLIKSGGENIYPAEIEQPLMGHPEVREAVVVRVADERWGEVPKVYVGTDQDSNLTPNDVEAYLEGRIARYQLPHYIEIVNARQFPRSTSGKVVRPEVEEWPVDDSERVRNP